MRNEDLNLIESLGYIPVGLGKNISSKNFLRDNDKVNISKKNPFYGEYTFHYWLWKNYLNNFKNNSWIGFCTYRRFWVKANVKKIIDFDDLKKKN